MKQQKANGASNRVTNRQLTDGVRDILRTSSSRVLGVAAESWHRHFDGRDASDACVQVRITGKAEAMSARFRSAQRQYASLAA